MEFTYKLSAHLANLQNLITPYWIVYFCIKSVVIQFSQCYYLWSLNGADTAGCSSSGCHSSGSSSTGHSNETSRTPTSGRNEFESNWAYMSLVTFGSVQRELGTTAVFCYTIYTSLGLYYPANPLFCKEFREIYSKEFFVFLSDPSASSQMIAKKLRECVDLAIESNINYLKSIMDFMSVKLDGSWSRLMSDVNKQKRGKLNNHSMSDYLKLSRNRPVLQQGHDLQMSPSVRRLVEGLKRQHYHLIALRREHSNVWPPNRYSARRRELSEDFLRIQTIVLILITVMVLGATIMAHYLGFKAIKSNQRLPKSLREFSWSERCMLVEQCIYAVLTGYWFSSPMVMVVVVFKDQMIWLEAIRCKFEHYRSFVEELDKLKQRTHLTMGRRMRRLSTRGAPIADSLGERLTPYSLSSNREQALELEELECRCDREAIEIYLAFRIFLRQIEGPMMLTRHVMLQNIIFIASILAMTLIFFRGIEAEHLRLLAIPIILVMTFVNGALCVCANFSATCTKTFNSLFSLIARALNHQESSVSFKQALELRTVNRHDRGRRKSLLRATHLPIEEATTTTNNRQEEYRFVPFELMPISADVNYLSECPMSPHTLLLWRRLAHDHRPLMDRFVCTVARFLKLDFRNILRFNFWIISIVLLALTSTSH